MSDESKLVRDIGIHDAYIHPLEMFDAKGGMVLRMLRPGNPLVPHFPEGIGEIYFSEVLAGEIKAWKMHTRQNQLFAVPMGEIRIALYDARADSPTLQVLSVIDLGRPVNYSLLRIPAGVWYGFRALHGGNALICNCADIPHDKSECQRLSCDSNVIPYSWDDSEIR